MGQSQHGRGTSWREVLTGGPRPAEVPLAPGGVVGERWVLEALLGEGGLAAVWRARDLRGGPDRAVKTLPRGAPVEARRERRLLREAELTARLQHPRVVAVHDAGVGPAGPWYAMDLVPGGSWEERIRALGRVPARTAVRHALDALEGLAAAHALGIVHRDVKPSNLLLDDEDRVVVADFGIAREADLVDTRTGAMMGSMPYMPPEQRVDAGAVGPAADVYGAAASLYHALTGCSPIDLFLAGPTSPRWHDVPLLLRPTLARAVHHDPDARFADAAALADALRVAQARLADDRSTWSGIAAPVVDPEPARPSWVLLVDDDPAHRRLVAAWLEREGMVVRTAGDGGEALRIAEASLPAAVVLDLHMPGLDGFCTMLGLRALRRELPILVITGAADPDTVVRAMRAGADDFLGKPLDRQVLVRRLRSLVEEAAV